jgi:FkbM family methyltransferase
MKDYLKRFPILSDTYRLLRLTAPLLMPARKSVSGRRIVGSNSSQLQEEYEPVVAEFLASKLNVGTRFVNVGANIGYWALMLRLRGFGGEIVLVEPDKINLRLLARNLKLNKIYDVTVKREAASNYSGHIDLYGFGTGISAIQGWAGGASRRSITVKCQQLDSIVDVKAMPTIFLIDVEGFELAILEGANLHLKQNSEFLVEIAISEHQPKGISINPNYEKVFKFMRDNGYKVFGWIPEYKELGSVERKLLLKERLENESQMYHFSKKDLQIN